MRAWCFELVLAREQNPVSKETRDPALPLGSPPPVVLPMQSALFALALLAPLASAADLWVGPVGSGLPYSEIQSAVDAAAPGDRVFVIAGTYGPVSIDREIQLSGDGSGVTRIVGLADANGAGQPALQVRDIAAHEHVWINGFEFAVDDSATTPSGSLARFTDLEGSLELCDLKVFRNQLDATAPGGDGAYLHFDNCPRVLGSDVRVITEDVPQLASAALAPFAALRATNSTMSFSDSRFDAAHTPASIAGLEISGSSAIELANSSLALGLTTVYGGHRGTQGQSANVHAGDGIRAIGSAVRIHGGKSNGVFGGHSSHVEGPGLAAAGAAIRLDGASSLEYASDVQLAGGKDADNQVAQAIEAESGAHVTARADRLPTMWVGPPIGQLGIAHTIFLEGDVGGVHLWWLALRAGPPLQFPGIAGTWWLESGFLIHHPAIVIPPSGIASQQVPIGHATGLLGLALFYQSLELDGANVQFALPWFASIELY